MKTILIFGDSIVYGASDEEFGGWVNRLKIALGKKGNLVYNLGICGDNTEFLLERFEKEIKARWEKEDGELIIIFSIGVNDSQDVREKGNRISLKDFEKNLKKLKEGAEKFTNQIIFLGLNKVDDSKTNPIPWSPTKSYSMKYIKEYNSIIEKFCKENKIKFINVLDSLQEGDLDDGLHPNSEGHQKILDKIEGKLKWH